MPPLPGFPINVDGSSASLHSRLAHAALRARNRRGKPVAHRKPNSWLATSSQ